MYDLVERIIISYICDLLPRTSRAKFSLPRTSRAKFSLPLYSFTNSYAYKKTYVTKSGKTITKEYKRYYDQKLHRQAKRFFDDKNKDFTDLCDLCNIEYAEILKIVNHCLSHNEDRLFGKRAIRAYFKAKRFQDD